MGKIDPRQPESLEFAPATTAAVRQPVLIIAVGRQRVGKTTCLNVTVETFRAHGAEIEIWNADLHNRTHTLSLFYEDALQPPVQTSLDDQKRWIEERVREMVIHRRDTVLDVGGGPTALNALIEELHLVEMLETRGIRVVLMYVLGNERADLDYLERFAEDRMFLPKATLLVFNAGLLTSGRSAKTAFDTLMGHEVVLGAVASGAKIVQMPALSCMAAVTDRGMSFTDFASGKQVDGFPESSFFDHERVWLWLNRDIPNMFLRIPAEWLPGIKQPLVANDRR
jgi:hypothetical protein